MKYLHKIEKRNPAERPLTGDVMQKHSSGVSRRVIGRFGDTIFYRQGLCNKKEKKEKSCSFSEWRKWCETAWQRI
jgi:hypothetical protein